MAEPGSAGRRREAPLVVAGVATAGVGLLAATRTWFAPRGVDAATSALVVTGGGQAPTATALGLVVLAAWGVVLVARGRWRRLVAALGSLAALGVAAVTLTSWWSVPDQLRARLGDLGAPTAQIDPTAWYVVAAGAAAASFGVLLLTWATVPRWPEMGRRYDAPGGAPTPAPAAPDSARELWSALDEGRDPTEGGG